MSGHDLNLLALGACLGGYAVLLVVLLIAFWDDLRPAQSED